MKILSKNQVRNFNNNIKTITSEFLEDQKRIKKNKKNLKIFIKKYGHLRPGTYDINSLRYDKSNKKLFFTSGKSSENITKKKNFILSKEQILKINNLLKSKGILINHEKLFDYISKSISSREYAKFIFTKSVSTILEKIKCFGLKNKISLKNINNLEIQDFYNSNRFNFKKNAIKSKKNEKENKINSMIKLPEILVDSSNAFIGATVLSVANFVTNKIITAETLRLSGKKTYNEIHNKIVLVENADPGFDWIFGHKIKGLITKFGGANSHMTIRCSELDVPAAIGCGEQAFKNYQYSKKIELNCDTKKIKIIT